MLRILKACVVLGVWITAGAAAGQSFTGEVDAGADTAANTDTTATADTTPNTNTYPNTSDASSSSNDDDVRAELNALRAEVEALKQQNQGQTPAAAEATEGDAKLSGTFGDWEVGMGGYFRAPMIIGISNRQSPDAYVGDDPQIQLSYGPNRLVDTNYYSFAYTRLQELDWVQLSFYARKKHVEAEVGWMGYWLQAASGYRNPDAGWAPGIARLTLDADVKMGSITPNVALTAGAWWPKFGYHKKYDTFTLGQYRQLGEQLQLTIPFKNGFKLTLFQGFGTGRDGKFHYDTATASPLYSTDTYLNLIHYEHVRFEYRDYVQVGLHFSNQWSRDPKNFSQGAGNDYVFERVKEAELKVIGAELNLHAPRAGYLWVSPSYVGVKNGWTLGNTGTEVMHSLGGIGLASNYMAYSTSLDESTGSGHMVNLGFVYENALSEILEKKRGEMIPDVVVSAFGLMALSSWDLPETSTRPQDKLKQFKWGADAELQIKTWLGLMARYDSVIYDLDNPGYVFSAISGRLTFSSHFLSGERIYLQYSHYIYGDEMTISGKWPWGTQLVEGSDSTQNTPAMYADQKPDVDVIKIQAEIAF
ncbi:MAG: hypothetical protein JXX29_01215 [Deltaproteobacteria bacterium]|nr:hypothetical protein [Deltaproteobacteria bacterium]MBN2670258.1 hypothetical protein [Deltaproteobacteria bacterium]